MVPNSCSPGVECQASRGQYSWPAYLTLGLGAQDADPEIAAPLVESEEKDGELIAGTKHTNDEVEHVTYSYSQVGLTPPRPVARKDQMALRSHTGSWVIVVPRHVRARGDLHRQLADQMGRDQHRRRPLARGWPGGSRDERLGA